MTPTKTTPIPGEPTLPGVRLNTVKPSDPVTGVVVSNERCTERKSAGFIRHIEIDVSGTPLEASFRAGQSFGVFPPGEDKNGKAHKLRLYSLACPTGGEDGEGKVVSTTVKRTIDEDWETGRLFLGIASNYLADLQVGEKVRLSGPSGKRFVLPEDPAAHDYLFFATGTGIAPFRGMLGDLEAAGMPSETVLVMGSPYRSDLLYHGRFTDLDARSEKFTYLTAISRENQPDGHDPMYVQDRLQTERDRLEALLRRERTLIYICGVAGMELGIFQKLAQILPDHALEQYLEVDAEAMSDISSWDRRMLHKKIRPTRRVFTEVY